MGRPSKYTPELATEICERLSKGEPLTVICRDEHMPCDRTVRRWQDEDATVASDIARARDIGYDQIALDGLAIVDDREGDPDAASRRIRADYRLKLLAKWDPKRYGDRQLVGSDPDNPLPSGVSVTFVRTDASSSD